AVVTGASAIVALGTAFGLGWLGLARLWRRVGRTRSIGSRVPRASSAWAVTAGAFVALFPGSLPHPPLLQGAVTGVCVLVALLAAQVVRGRVPLLCGNAHRASLAVSAVTAALMAVWFDSVQNVMRARVGWEP